MTKRPLVSQLKLFWRDMPLARKGIVLILLPLLLLLGSLSFLYSKEIELSKFESQLRLALQNQRDIQAVHTQLLEASNGVRDFLLTDDKHFLLNFDQAQQQLPLMMQTLEVKLETQAQKTRLKNIRTLVAQSLRNLQFLADSAPGSNTETMVNQFKQQINSLDQLRLAIEKLNQQEAYLVTQEQNNVALQRARNFRVTLLAALLGLIGSVITLRLFLYSIVNRVRALRDSAGHLAKAEPLALPFSSQDELGELSDELDQASQLLANKVEEAEQAKHEAEEANRAKTVFLSRTSHELRTPLNAILGFAQLLETELKNEQHQDNIKTIKRAGEHLLKVINNVLDIASIESGERNLQLQGTDVNLVIEEAINYIAPLGSLRDMEIKQKIAPNLIAYADHQKLFQVMLNLLSNALKYGPVNSTVLVKAYRHTAHIHIEVLDEGQGIPESLRQHLFTPFDRLGAEQSNIEGSGLGLALSQQVIHAMGGSLNVSKSQSLFSIKLPAHQAAPETAPNQTTSALPEIPDTTLATHKQTVLLIEDNQSNRTLVEAILKREANIKLLHSHTLKAAQIMLAQSEISLILLDLHLPDGSGETLLDYLQTHDALKKIPVLILSADAMPETIARLKTMSIAGYLTKPLNVADFSHKVKSLLAENNGI